MKITTQAALATGLVLVFAAVIAASFVTADHELARQLAQGLLNIVIGIAGFYFGSSQSSSKKDETIAAALNPPSAADHQPGDPQ